MNVSINPEICKQCKHYWMIEEDNQHKFMIYCVDEETDILSFACPISKQNAEIIFNQYRHNRWREVFYDILGNTKTIIHPREISVSKELKEALKEFHLDDHCECPYYMEHQLEEWNNE